MAYSVFDLAFTYIERFYDEEPSTEEKREIIEQLKDQLSFGFTTEDIIKHFKAFMIKYPGERPHIPTLFSKLHPSRPNLMNPDGFYYHNQLRITPGAPKRHLDINTGQITKMDEEYYLEMRGSYTLEDLANYYFKQFNANPSHDDMKRVIGGLKYLMKTYPLDLLLFMIDTAVNWLYSEDMDMYNYNVLKLSDWKTKAEEQLNEKMTENKLSGDDRIVPRRRVLSFRSRDSN